ncbi:MAG: penicillin-binding protein [Lactobacillales bacterium]|nr:penicillin-binding protein [Lactobacillales bacterium]
MSEQQKPPNKYWFTLNIVLRVIRSLVLVAVSIGLILSALFAGIGVGYFSYLVSDTNPPTKEQLEREINDISEVSQLAYSDGTTISTIKSDLVRTRVDSQNIAPIMKKAIVSTEDEYFYKHHGVVPKAVLRALISDATGMGGSSGGSTLTQQLVKQQILTDEPTFKRKANEILLATQIEKYFNKDEIITTYLNVSPFGRNNKGENIAGIKEAALGIFGVTPDKLSIPQAAFLAGLPQSPIVYSPYDGNGQIKSDENLAIGLDRKNFVLFNMYREKVITKKEYDDAKNYDLKQDFLPHQEAENSTNGYLYYEVLKQATDVLARQLAKDENVSDNDMNDEKIYNAYYDRAGKNLRRGGYKVTSTINKDIYNTMQLAVAQLGYLLDEGEGQVQTGNVLMENNTGKILGFVGGRDFNTNQNNHAFDTARSPGSSIKPLLVYGPAIDVGLIGSESRLSNFPTKYSNGEYILHDGEKGTNSFISTRTALEYSWNVPAYFLYQTLKNPQYKDPDVEYMKKMNFDISNLGHESTPMGGGAEVSVAQQVNGYQTIANHGEYQQGYMIENITDSKGKVIYQHVAKPVQVYKSATASVLNNLLRSVIDSEKTTVFKSALRNINPTLASADWSGKTGTTDDFGDSWLIVSTPKMTIGSWTGYDDFNQKMYRESGPQNSTYLANLIHTIYQVDPNLFGIEDKFTLDPTVIQSTVSDFTGEKPGKIIMNGQTITVPGKNVTSYWATDGPPMSAYKFGIGGTDSDYSIAWGGMVKKETPKTTTSSSKPNDKENKDSNN